MTDLARAALNLALEHIGEHETPPGSNRGPNIDKWLRRCGLDPEKGAYSWCAAFVTCMVIDACEALSHPRTFRGSASVHHLYDLNPALELDAPEPGCVFIHLLPDGHGHTGFVLKVNDDGSCDTVEGNSDAHGSRTGGSVVTNVRPVGYATRWLAIR